MSVVVRHANPRDPADARAIVRLLGSYAADPHSGGGTPMTDQAKRELPGRLDAVPGRAVLLAEVDGRSVGLAVAFMGFSTFAARPLLNLHDVVVEPAAWGRGVGGRLLDAVEGEARRRGCVSITLEVLGANTGAARLYRRHGYAGGVCIEPATAAMFFKKTL